MSKSAFQPQIVSATIFRVEVSWSVIGGRNFPAVEALFKSGVIENQAWRVTEDGMHYCVFYFRSEDAAEKFVKAFGGYRV